MIFLACLGGKGRVLLLAERHVQAVPLRGPVVALWFGTFFESLKDHS